MAVSTYTTMSMEIQLVSLIQKALLIVARGLAKRNRHQGLGQGFQGAAVAQKVTPTISQMSLADKALRALAKIMTNATQIVLGRSHNATHSSIMKLEEHVLTTEVQSPVIWHHLVTTLRLH